jgi:hypothetical protein
MSQTVLAQALPPFYSTKGSGTGIGPVLARDRGSARRPYSAGEPRCAASVTRAPCVLLFR